MDSRQQKIAELIIDLDGLKYDVGSFIITKSPSQEWINARFEALRDKLKKLKEEKTC